MAAQFKRQKGFKDQKMNTDRVKISDHWEQQEFPKGGKWMQARFVGPVVPYGMHWIDIVTKKGEVAIPKYCLAFDAETGERDSTKKCPYCKLENANFAREFYVNAIVRPLQEDEPNKKSPHTGSEKKTFFKDKDSNSWTPVRVLRLPSSLVGKLAKLIDLNRAKDPKTKETRSYELSDPKFGCDVHLSYDPEAAGTDKYGVQKSDRSPLTEEEMEYLVWDIEDKAPLDTLDEAKKEAEALKLKAPESEDSGKGGGSSSDDDDDDGDYDDDDEPVVPKKSDKKGKGKAKVVEDDDDDADEDEDDEDDEDDEPVAKKSKGKAKPVAKKGKVEEEEDEDDDDDLDDDDDEDEDDEPVAKKGKAKDKPVAKGKVKKVEEDDEDEDDLDDEDEDEDEEPVTKKGKAKPAAKKGKSKAKVEEDDDDEDDDDGLDDLDDDEDDEDDEPVTKKKKTR